MSDRNSFRRTIDAGGKSYDYFSIKAAEEQGYGNFSRLPFSLKVLLENLLRHLDGKVVHADDIKALNTWLKNKTSTREIAYHPARVLMQDFTGVPAVVDLAAMRTAMEQLGGDPNKINPLSPVDLVIDHSVQVDKFASNDAFKINVATEMSRNLERYELLRWGQTAFSNFAVVPPGTGICHQVNLEFLAKCVWQKVEEGKSIAYPDTLVGTDSHTTMINGLGVLGWGVGGIEAEAAILGQPISMLIPEVIGFKLKGKLNEGVTATDLVLTVTQMLRERGVVGKFVEYFGPGLSELPLADRATLSNMAPEYGATCGFFPIDQVTIDYLKLSNRSAETIALVEAYTKEQGLWHSNNAEEPIFTDFLQLDLATVKPSVAGPKRPQDKVYLTDLPEAITAFIKSAGKEKEINKEFASDHFTMHHGDIVIAAITSCTNTSNPSVMLAAGIVAKKALAKGLTRKPWVKTSLAPGSKVVTEYLEKAGLQTHLNDLGFNLVGYGCTTCIGNSGPLPDDVAKTVSDNDLVACAVLSGNRNFEGRIHPLVKANWLASPPLVVAYAIAGTTNINLSEDVIGQDQDGKPVYLKEIWPTTDEINEALKSVTNEGFKSQYADVFSGDNEWRSIDIPSGNVYAWNDQSTYVQLPPFFEGLTTKPAPVKNIMGANMLALLGDSVTTDHISPAGAIKADSPAGHYLKSHGVDPIDFNSFGSRRGNHEVMMRGTFANIRIRNEMAPGTEGGFTTYIPDGKVMSIYDAAMKYKDSHTPLVVVAGKEYGTGSSRDWAAKGTVLLGVKAVIAESFERIHRSNLIGMGVLPLQFKDNQNRKSLNLSGKETFDIVNLEKGLTPRMDIHAVIHYPDGSHKEVTLLSRIDTQNEVEYYENGGILQLVLRKLLK